MDWRSLFESLLLQTILSQTPVPPVQPSPLPEVELLRSQLEFLRASYGQLFETVKIIFIVLGVAGSIVAYFFGKSFRDTLDLARKDMQIAVERVREEAQRDIPRLVQAEVSSLVQAEVENLTRTLQREQVVGSTLVDYYLPNGTDQPSEFKLVAARRFKKVRFRTDLQSITRSPGGVVILDLKNWVMTSNQKFSELSEAEQQQPGTQQVKDLLDTVSESVVVVVYVRGRLFYLNEVSDRYVIAANNPITLVGNAADGAYIVAGDRTLH